MKRLDLISYFPLREITAHSSAINCLQTLESSFDSSEAVAHHHSLLQQEYATLSPPLLHPPLTAFQRERVHLKQLKKNRKNEFRDSGAQRLSPPSARDMSGRDILVSCSSDGTIKIWSQGVASDIPLLVLGIGVPSFSPTPGLSGDPRLQYETQPTTEQGGHQGSVQMIKLFEQGNKILSCSLDQTVKLFDVNAATCIATLQVRHQGIKQPAPFNVKSLTTGCASSGFHHHTMYFIGQTDRLYNIWWRRCKLALSLHFLSLIITRPCFRVSSSFGTHG